MAFDSPINWTSNYQLGTDILISNDTETTTLSTTYVLAKQIDIALKLYYLSTFVVSWEMRSVGGAQVQAYATHNGTMIGSVQSTNNNVYTLKQQDITGESWRMEDYIELYIRTAVGDECRVRNFRIYGIETPFVNTKETV